MNKDVLLKSAYRTKLKNMGTIIDVFRQLLLHGCGIRLEDALVSDRFNQLLARQESLHDQYDETDPLGIALRAGHIVMGRLLNTATEAEVCELARSESSPYGHGIAHRALIQYTGEMLVGEAQHCFSENMMELSRRWKSATANEQVEIAEALYRELQSDSQLEKHELTMTNLGPLLRRTSFANRGGHEQILPRQYGVWNKQTCEANCQGKAQMLTAFGRMVGARTIAVHPAFSSERVVHDCRVKAIQAIESDMNSRGIIAEPHFMNSLMAHRMNMLMDDTKSFHLSIAFEVSDGRWVLVDPHAINWGVFPEQWGVASIYERLSYYAEVLPGLSLYASDEFSYRKLEKEAETETEAFLNRSRMLEVEFKKSGNLLGFVEYWKDSEEMTLLLADLGHTAPIEDLRKRHYVATQLLYGHTDEDMLSLGTLMRGVTDLTFIKERMDCLLSVYHCIALDAINDRWNDSGAIVHPRCAFNLPEYSLALSALNSLSLDCFMDVESFFMDYAFDELSMHNAMTVGIRRGGKSLKLAMAAAQTLRELPFVHAMTKLRMEILLGGER